MLLGAVSLIPPDSVFSFLLLGHYRWHFSTHTSVQMPESSNSILAVSAGLGCSVPEGDWFGVTPTVLL